MPSSISSQWTKPQNQSVAYVRRPDNWGRKTSDNHATGAIQASSGRFSGGNADHSSSEPDRPSASGAQIAECSARDDSAALLGKPAAPPGTAWRCFDRCWAVFNIRTYLVGTLGRCKASSGGSQCRRRYSTRLKTASPKAKAAYRVTVREFIAFNQAKHKISMLTAYDYPTAAVLDAAGIDAILVGDSMSMVVQGHETTLPVTLDEMIYHAEMVGRAVERAIVVVDLPFPTNHLGVHRAIESAGRILKETRCRAVKLEGGADQAE